MLKKYSKYSLFVFSFVILGFFINSLLTRYAENKLDFNFYTTSPSPTPTDSKNISLGFLPFWLLQTATNDYSKYFTHIAYFNLTVDKDGSIKRYTNPGEGDPGYFTLVNGKVDDFIDKAQSTNQALSLVVFSSNDDDIENMLVNPEESARNLLEDTSLLIKKYGFTDLNLDIEKVKEASPSSRLKFSRFVRQVSKDYKSYGLKTLSIDVAPIALVKETNLVNPSEVGKFVDYVVLMDYDYHHFGSSVTGPVSPQYGAGSVSEYDTEVAVEKALEVIPKNKFVLAIPLYGYEWETLQDSPRSATIPSTARVISSKRASQTLSDCKSCVGIFDDIDKETHYFYKNKTGSYTQIFYPDKNQSQAKVNFINDNKLAGLAVWALGYEDDTILQPLAFLNR